MLEAAGSQFLQLSSSLSREKAARVEEIRALYRAGKRNTAYEKLRELRDDTSWPLLEEPLRAKVLRVLAGFALDIGKDIATARALADESKLLDPNADQSVIRAAIAYYEHGAMAAFDSNRSIDNIDGQNYQLGLLLELGSIDQLLSTLADNAARVGENADTLRIHALALVAKKDLAGARALVQRAIAEQPEWEGVRMAAAIVDYYSALSPAALPDSLSAFPPPVPWEFVRRDDESREYLRRAEGRFLGLAKNLERPEDWRRTFALWHLACIANDPTRQQEAVTLSRSLLTDQPGDELELELRARV